MDDYKKMYLTLFNGISDIIEQLQILQQQSEELFISQNNIYELKQKSEE